MFYIRIVVGKVHANVGNLQKEDNFL